MIFIKNNYLKFCEDESCQKMAEATQFKFHMKLHYFKIGYNI